MWIVIAEISTYDIFLKISIRKGLINIRARGSWNVAMEFCTSKICYYLFYLYDSTNSKYVTMVTTKASTANRRRWQWQHHPTHPIVGSNPGVRIPFIFAYAFKSYGRYDIIDSNHARWRDIIYTWSRALSVLILVLIGSWSTENGY